MWFYISQPNSVVLEVDVDPKAEGQELIDQVFRQLDIIEQDYFGLQYRGSKNELLWLNLRNPICRQLCGAPPYRLQLRVKFCVFPHYILQDTTRHQFFLQVKADLLAQKLHLESVEQIVCIVAWMAQADFGDYMNQKYQLNLYKGLLEGIIQPTHQLVTSIAEEHSKLEGVSRASAEYHMLQEVAKLENYGVECHEARNCLGETVHLGVGPEGICIYSKNMERLNKIEYATIARAAQSGRGCVMNVFDDKGDCQEHVYKLVSQRAANALYRSITEMHSFYRCDTVQNAVSNQFCRDFKGTLVSIFNENTTLGREYVFDIKRTCREAYDHFRRVLYQPGNTQHSQGQMEGTESIDCDTVSNAANCNQHCQVLQEKLQRIQESFMCQVCRDAEISVRFSPCGHVICCQDCSTQLNDCPYCRSEIENVQRVFMPTVTF